MTFKVIINIPVILITFMLGFYLPELSPKDILCGMKISPIHVHTSNHTGMVREYRRLYTIICGSYSLFFTIVFCINKKYYLLISGLILLLVLMEIVQNIVYKKAKQLGIFKNSGKTYEDYIIVDERPQKNRNLSLSWFLIPGLIIAISIIVGAALYQIVPNFLPSGLFVTSDEAHFIKKSIYLIAIPSSFQSAVFLMAYIIFIKVSKYVFSSHDINTEAAEQKGIIFRYIWAITIIAVCTLVDIFFFLTELKLLTLISSKVLFASSLFIILIIIAILIISLYETRINSRSNIVVQATFNSRKNTTYSSLIDRTDDAYWILASFYFNPHDPSPWIKKRSGKGICFNFGRPLIWFMFSIPLISLSISLVYLFINKI